MSGYLKTCHFQWWCCVFSNKCRTEGRQLDLRLVSVLYYLLLGEPTWVIKKSLLLPWNYFIKRVSTLYSIMIRVLHMYLWYWQFINLCWFSTHISLRCCYKYSTKREFQVTYRQIKISRLSLFTSFQLEDDHFATRWADLRKSIESRLTATALRNLQSIYNKIWRDLSGHKSAKAKHSFQAR